MASCARPKIYRSNNGCCICGAKSSSSRFTSSLRYEADFDGCFQLDGDIRTGDICNACVLLVKRFRKQSKEERKSWAHVVDARVGPGLKSMSKIKSRQMDSLSPNSKPSSKYLGTPTLPREVNSKSGTPNPAKLESWKNGTPTFIGVPTSQVLSAAAEKLNEILQADYSADSQDAFDHADVKASDQVLAHRVLKNVDLTRIQSVDVMNGHKHFTRSKRQKMPTRKLKPLLVNRRSKVFKQRKPRRRVQTSCSAYELVNEEYVIRRIYHCGVVYETNSLCRIRSVFIDAEGFCPAACPTHGYHDTHQQKSSANCSSSVVESDDAMISEDHGNSLTLDECSSDMSTTSDNENNLCSPEAAEDNNLLFSEPPHSPDFRTSAGCRPSKAIGGAHVLMPLKLLPINTS